MKHALFPPRPSRAGLSPRRALLALPLIALAAGPLAAQAPAAGQAQQTEVGIVTIAETDVPYTQTLPGRAAAFESASIRPRVGGVIEEIPYNAGRPVKQGEVLFRIEKDTYEAALTAAEAARASAEVAVETAQSQVDRYSRIEGVGVTQSDVESARATLLQAQADLKSAEASLQTAQLDLDRTDIRSPIEGWAEVPEVSVGALVTANQTDALTTVTRSNPIYVDAQESSVRMMRNRAMRESGKLTFGDALEVKLTLENGQVYERDGEMVSPSAQVSSTTGTVDLRFQFDNPDYLILPGQFLRLEVTLGTTRAMLVPQRATTRKSDGTLTAFVAQDGTAKQVTLTTAGTYESNWIATDGVAPGDALIVDGLRSLKAGAAVTTVPVTINADGVVEDATKAAGE